MLTSIAVLSVLLAFSVALPATPDSNRGVVPLCQGRDSSCIEAEEVLKASAALYGNGDDMVEIDVGRNAITKDKKRWRNGVVPYVFDKSIGTNLRTLILNAQEHITKRTEGCITFVERKKEKNHVKYAQKKGCYSSYGMVGGSQIISLGVGCEFMGTVLHEILHALGFEHENNRTDRDQYLELNLKNVAKANKSAFKKLKRNRIYDDFDYRSIMIYGEYSFAVNPSIKTIWDKTGKNALIDAYYKNDLTNSDVYRIKKLYKCGAYYVCNRK